MEVANSSLPVRFDASIFESKWNRLIEEVGTLPGGLAAAVMGLENKSRFIREAMQQREAIVEQEVWVEFLRPIFTARRKLHDLPAAINSDRLGKALGGLMDDSIDPVARLNEFCEQIGFEESKKRRAVWNLGAEILHFSNPDVLPLMTHWVWDSSTMTGAYREFIRGNDTMQSIPLEMDTTMYTAAIEVLTDLLRENGYYKDIPFLVDMVLAKAYGDYVRAISGGYGMIQAEFAAKSHPLDLDFHLLGLDAIQKKLAV